LSETTDHIALICQLYCGIKLDGLPKQEFYVVGNIDEATTEATSLELENNWKK